MKQKNNMKELFKKDLKNNREKLSLVSLRN